MDLINLLERIRAVNERPVLISLLVDIKKNLTDMDLRPEQYGLVLSGLLDRLSPHLFGLLTEKEFTLFFGPLFTNSPSNLDTISLLIHSIDTVRPDEFYKFSKTIELLEIVLEKNLQQILASEFSEDPNSEMILEDFSHSLTSFSDRLYNFLGSQNRRNLAIGTQLIYQFERHLLDGLLSAIDSHQNDGNLNMKLCSRILVDYGTTSSEFLREFVGNILEKGFADEICPHLFVSKASDFRKYERFVISLVNLSQNANQLQTLFGDTILHNDNLKRIFNKILLVTSSQALSGNLASRNSAKIAKYFATTSPQLLLEKFDRLLNAFSDQCQFLEFADLQNHFQLAITIIDFAKEVSVEDRAKKRDQITHMLITFVPDFLQLSDISRRQLGMYLAETVANLFECAPKNEQLHFDYVESDPMLRELKMVVSGEYNGDEAIDEMIGSLKIEKGQKRQRKRVVDVRTRILDSDDEEEGEEDKGDEKLLQELEETEREGKNGPFYMRDCLEGLGDREDLKTVALALRTLPRLIQRKAVGFDEVAEELLERIIYLEDRFRIPNFMELRREISKFTLAKAPQLVPSVVRLAFGKSCTMSLRYFVLDSILDAATWLASNGQELHRDKCADPENKKDPNVKGPKIVRRSAKLDFTQPSASLSVNNFAKVAPQFIFPLLDFGQISGPHLDLFDRDHILLGKILWTVSQLISLAKNSPSIIRIVSVVLLSLGHLRTNQHVLVLNACEACYLAIVDSVPVETLRQTFPTELRECLEWLLVVLNSRQCETDETLSRSTNFAIVRISQVLREDSEN